MNQVETNEYWVRTLDLMHDIFQLFWFIVRPGNLLLIVLLVGTVLLWVRPDANGRLWLTAVSGVLLLVTLLPVHGWIAQPLEQRFPLPQTLPEAIDGIIVLGGIVQNETASASGTLAVNDNAERIMVSAGLVLRYPQARLLVTGRNERHRTLIAWFEALGLGRGRLAFEAESRNTFENALFSERMIKPKPDEIWILVTSAKHMPRAVGVFRKVGWPVLPYPVDFRSLDDESLTDRLNVASNLVRLANVIKEWIGLIAYYALDRSDEIFPGPVIDEAKRSQNTPAMKACPWTRSTDCRSRASRPLGVRLQAMIPLLSGFYVASFQFSPKPLQR